MKVYAGIGSRQTPMNVIGLMQEHAAEKARKGWYLRSGNAKGADQAFSQGANSVDPTKVLLYLPWSSYENQAIQQGNHIFDIFDKDCEKEAIELVKKLHPAPERLTPGGFKLHCRNVFILLGKNLDKPVDEVVYWSPNGLAIGGTGMGLRIATEFKIPCKWIIK